MVANWVFERISREFGDRWDAIRVQWQRRMGEPVSILKLAAVLLGAGAYKRLDPFPQNKADNLAVYGFLAYLLYLAIKPATAELSGPYAELESEILEAVTKMFAKDQPEVVVQAIHWLGDMPPHVEAALRELEKRFKDPENLAYFVGNAEIREAFRKAVEKSWKPMQSAPSLGKELQDAWKKVDTFLGTSGVQGVRHVRGFLGLTPSARRLAQRATRAKDERPFYGETPCPACGTRYRWESPVPYGIDMPCQKCGKEFPLVREGD